jgi:hypothetical protein
VNGSHPRGKLERTSADASDENDRWRRSHNVSSLAESQVPRC